MREAIGIMLVALTAVAVSAQDAAKVAAPAPAVVPADLPKVEAPKITLTPAEQAARSLTTLTEVFKAARGTEALGRKACVAAGGEKLITLIGANGAVSIGCVTAVTPLKK